MKRADDVTYEELDEALGLALNRLFQREDYLFRFNANERSLTFHFARYLRKQLKGWDVDVEFNRDIEAEDYIKRLRLNPPQPRVDDDEAVTVFPDIIVHRRGTRENLLVIEVKKKGHGDHDFDLEKLRAFTRSRGDGGLGYRFGVHVVFTVGHQKAPALTTWFGPKPTWKRKAIRRNVTKA